MSEVATMLHTGPHGSALDADHAADPYDVLLRAGICRRCRRPCAWPPLLIPCECADCARVGCATIGCVHGHSGR